MRPVFAAFLSLLTDVWRTWRCHHDYADECEPPACRRWTEQAVTDQPDPRWQCQTCGRWWPVITLAEDCRRRHERETTAMLYLTNPAAPAWCGCDSKGS